MQPPFHRLEEFVSLSPTEVALARSWLAGPRRVTRAEPIRREGDPVGGVFFLVAGWVSSSVDLSDGRRQIVKLHLPGDMMGFPSLALAAAGETLEAVTDATICTIPNAALGQVLASYPGLAAGIFLSTQMERVALMQKLTWIGGASALARMAAFLLDLHRRLDAAGLVDHGAFEFPLTQHQLGDLLGLTSVHVNRTFRRLDATGLVERKRGRMHILDFDGLRNLSPNLPPQPGGHAAWARLGGEVAPHPD